MTATATKTGVRNLMRAFKITSKNSGAKAKVSVRGPGVITVNSGDVIKTEEAKRQIDAMERLQSSGNK